MRYKVLNDEFFDVFDQGKKFNLEYGGAGSGKSISIAQYFVLGLISGDGYRRAVFRKSFPSLKLTTYLVLKEIMEDWGIVAIEHKTDHFFEYNGNRLYYLSLDNPEKIKGGEFKEIWLEEATEFTEDDFKQLTIRLARDKYAEDVRFFLSFNPLDENIWVVKKIPYALSHPDKYSVHHSTYKDNIANLSQSFIDELESYINIDENFYKIYTLGIPGVLRNRIYTHFQIENSAQWDWTKLATAFHCYGLDFGYNHAMALCEIWYFDGEFYIKELFYKTEWTTDDLAIWLQLHGISHTDYIFADSAEPDRIDTLASSRQITTTYKETGEEIAIYVPGFNIYPAKKDVKAGIDYIKGKKIHLCSNAIHGIKEYNTYRYKEDKNGVVFDEPIKVNDHFLDSLRYATFSSSELCGIPSEVGFDPDKPIGYSARLNKNDDVWEGVYEDGY